MNRVITTVLDAERLERGLFTVRPQSIDLAALVREAAEALGTQVNRIAVDAPATLTARVDPDLLRQAIENLLANATKHSPSGVPVLVAVHSCPRADGMWATVTISDRGPGIPAELMPRLFERFAAGPGSTGLGLGLYLARRIARAHGGDVWVERPGQNQGTTFTLALPLDRVPNG